MSLRSRRSVLAAALALTLACASLAQAGFSSSAATGPQALSSASLAAASGLAAANGRCVRNVSIEVDLTWTASPSTFADGYEILRATASGGPYSSVGTVSGGTTTSFTDRGVTFSTTYFYVVRATRNAWQSADSNEARVTTLNTRCR